MTNDAWPNPDVPSGPLPRIDDLPIAKQGYEQEAVRQAFDAFYRHSAQLDASLRALEAVDVFRRDADALRNDLRALRALGFGGGAQEPAWTMQRYDASPYRVRSSQVPAAALRLAAEAALIIAVAVIAGVAHFRPVVIVALMAAAFAIVALSEWLAGRARFVPPAVAFLPAAESEPVPYVEAPARAWGVDAEPDEETEPEALTMVASAEEIEAAADATVDPWERVEPIAGDDGPEPEPAAVLAERAGLFRRRRR
jgi:hypothetical protein